MALDWHGMFALSVPPLELVVRGSVIYWFLFLIFRVFLRRDAGSIGLADILLLVIIADASQNAMAGEYRSITDGMILIGTIVGWNMLLDWLAWRSHTLQRLLEPRPLVLVRNGQIQYSTLRREFMSEEELMSKLREHGVEKLAEVKRAYMESSGSITVLKR
jgi:uncharacterized membrane protein YcaP (DUF421 family)